MTDIGNRYALAAGAVERSLGVAVFEAALLD